MSVMPVESVEYAHSMTRAIPLIEHVLDHSYRGLSHKLRTMGLNASASTLQGCLPLLLQQVPAERLIELVGQKRYEELRTCYQEMSHLDLWYSLELRNVLEILKAKGIQVMVLKGADLAATVYPQPGLRYFDDIDLMVQPEDLPATTAILEQLGYSYYQEYRFEAISKRRAGFVYVKSTAAGRLVFEIHTSPHSNEMGISFESVHLWERARPITVCNSDVCGMGLEDLLIYLCWHYRSHFFGRLIWLYDIALILMLYGDQLDWALVRQLAHERGLAATLYYCKHLCAQKFNTSLPETIKIEECAPPVIVQRLIAHFIGDDLTLVLRPTAYRERKLLQRLMVDNTNALCLIGLRTIVPSPEHLGRLYMQHSRLPMHLYWLYYPLHPLLLIWEYFRERRHKKSPHG